MTWLEALVLLLPSEVGGRHTAVSPRDGSYRPFVRLDDRLVRMRIIEGPPSLAPGDEARVVAELEALPEALRIGAELDVVERDQHVVGLLTVMRLWRAA